MSDRHSPLRVLRWHDRIKNVIGGGWCEGPIRANLDLTNLCSHACPWCEPVDFRKATIADKRHTLDSGVAWSVIKDLANLRCKAIQFSGGGEPTLHPDFGELLSCARNLGMRTMVITHGGYLDRFIDPLFRSADHVRISLDASCEEEHRIMHGSKPGEFQRVTDNVRKLVERKFAGGGPEVGLAYNLADCNSGPESIERLVKLAEGLGVDFVQLRPLSEETPHFLTGRMRGLNPIFLREANKVRFEFLGQRGQDVFNQREFDKCYAALTLAVISANGDVAACCDRRDIVFGNVNEKPFREIWLSKAHRDKAANIAPKLCTRCVQCGFNKAVESFIVRNDAVPELL